MAVEESLKLFFGTPLIFYSYTFIKIIKDEKGSNDLLCTNYFF